MKFQQSLPDYQVSKYSLALFQDGRKLLIKDGKVEHEFISATLKDT